MFLHKVYFSTKERDFFITSLRLALPLMDEKDRHVIAVLINMLAQNPKQEFLEPKFSVIIKFLLNMIKARLPTFRY